MSDIKLNSWMMWPGSPTWVGLPPGSTIFTAISPIQNCPGGGGTCRGRGSPWQILQLARNVVVIHVKLVHHMKLVATQGKSAIATTLTLENADQIVSTHHAQGSKIGTISFNNVDQIVSTHHAQGPKTKNISLVNVGQKVSTHYAQNRKARLRGLRVSRGAAVSCIQYLIFPR